MNISDYFTKVKNLTDVLAFIRALVDDEDSDRDLEWIWKRL
jgi:hypothetical protein